MAVFQGTDGNDTLTLTGSHDVSTFSRVASTTNPIVGSWYLSDSPQQAVVITFLSDGQFFVAEDGDSIADPSGRDGMERGTYTWNSSTGDFTKVITVDTNGEWGMSHSVISSLQVNGDALTITSTNGVSSLSRVPNSINPIVGGWYLSDSPQQAVVITFLSDGQFFVAEDGDSIADPSGRDGMERGTYTWNSSTGDFTKVTAVDTSGEWGMSHSVINSVRIANGNGTSNDTFIGGAGNDTLDGGAGIDTSIYSGNRAAYTVTKTAAGYTVSGSADGTDTLSSIERLQFSDTKVALDLAGNAGTTAKILGAVFGKAEVANKAYVGIGLSLLDGGMSYEALIALALGAAGASTPLQIVNLLWTNVIGSAPTTGQALPFVDMLNGGMTAGQLGVLAADTQQNQININLVGLTNSGIEYV